MREKIGKVLRFVLRWGIRVVVLVVVLLVGAFIGGFAPQLYHHFSLFPRQAVAWKALEAQRAPVSLKSGWNEYRGVMHSHSEVSHDSEAAFPHIVDALHKAKCQFIFMSDHPVDGKLDYSLGWNGIHDGILFVRGFEMHGGFMPWAVPEGTVLAANDPPDVLAKKIRDAGGLLGIAHSEGWRDWEIPEIEAMEIYNIHTDLLDELMDKHSRAEIAKEFIVNFWGYGDETLRSMFDFWVLAMLVQKWDEKNLHRHITAIAANDIHENVGIRGFYTAQDTLVLVDTGHKPQDKKILEHKLNSFERWILKLLFGPLEPDKQLFRLDADPYERSARFVNTHLLAKELTEPALVEAVRAGRAFIAFNMLADATGFAYVAQGNGQQVTMGERIAFSPGLKLLAESPIPCKFTLVRNGRKVTDKEGRAFEFEVKEPGKYRIEADVKVPGEVALVGEDAARDMAPWVLTNPIEVAAEGTP